VTASAASGAATSHLPPLSSIAPRATEAPRLMPPSVFAFESFIRPPPSQAPGRIAKVYKVKRRGCVSPNDYGPEMR
jgi:hypothetical protein